MEDAGDATFPDGRFQHLRRVSLGLAGVDHQGQAGLPGGLDMRVETLALRLAIGFVVIVIEPALADCDHTGM